MPPKLRELKALLRCAGFGNRPGKGSHSVWSHPLLADKVTLSGSDGDDAMRYQIQRVQSAVQRSLESEERTQ